ncbi:hypothetical protein ACFX5Q_17795 [Mesorhizobium sp. IMUNJ 23033]
MPFARMRGLERLDVLRDQVGEVAAVVIGYENAEQGIALLSAVSAG